MLCFLTNHFLWALHLSLPILFAHEYYWPIFIHEFTPYNRCTYWKRNNVWSQKMQWEKIDCTRVLNGKAKRKSIRKIVGLFSGKTIFKRLSTYKMYEINLKNSFFGHKISTNSCYFFRMTSHFSSYWRVLITFGLKIDFVHKVDVSLIHHLHYSFVCSIEKVYWIMPLYCMWIQ